ncbi:golgin subfamily A member 6-like protein 22 [Temnothorax curvispinosus]|uniref:Golgin subfamily A member 6-like protein 22 n=1 Tax=Temnothorax curvispinosus TaxID=300111 RepID=A0A6J1QLK4_9HYME|nr:golgin subfamily A member 6-like protein 22 [Temnothorax curvispinosus]
MVEVLPGSEEEWREWCWEEREKRKDEKEMREGVKEKEEGVGNKTWQTGERIRRWVEEEMARRRVGLAGPRKKVDSGDKGERREVEEVEKEGWRVVGRKGGVGEGEKKASQVGEKRGLGGSEEKMSIGREEEREVDRREEDETEKTRRLREKVKRMEEEREQKEKRRRNVIWRGLDGRDSGERRCFMEWATENVMGRMPRIRRVWERRGEGGKEVVLVEMEDEKERAELLEKYWEFRQRWGIGVDEDLTMEERRMKWRIMEKARVEKEKGRGVRTDNRRIWVEGKEIFWNEEKEKWEER